jgi:hypothetical protein
LLLEQLDLASATRAISGAAPIRARRDESLDHLAEIQRELLDPELGTEDRQRLLADLTRAEADEATLREDLAAADPAFAAMRTPRHATLAEISAELEPGEAMLSFQLAADRDVHGEPLGGSWVVVITREGARAVRLAARPDLEATIDAFIGLIARRDGSERVAATAL